MDTVHAVNNADQSQQGGADLQCCEVHAQEQGALLTPVFQMLKALVLNDPFQAPSGPEPGYGHLHNTDSGGFKILSHQVFPLLLAQFGETEANIGFDNMPPAGAEGQGQPAD